jgi:PDZ domain-containing protein
VLNSFKYLIKKYKLYIFLALAINIPIILICTIRTNYGVISKGDTVEFTSVVNIENGYKEEGSFSTIYVMDIEGSTPFMNLIAKYDNEMESYYIEEYESILSDSESYFAGKLMYASSISQAIITAYQLAMKDDSNIKLDYSFDGYYITYKNKESELKIGDNIRSIKRVLRDEADNYLLNPDGSYLYSESYEIGSNEYLECIKNPRVNDIWYLEESTKINNNYTVNKTDNFKEVTLKKGESFSLYPIYNINLDNTSPKIIFNTNTIGGPSGGLLQTLSIYNKLTAYDYTNGLKIAGTGTINSITHNIGAIGGIKEKIPTAIDDNVDIFFCPKANYNEAYLKYESIKNHDRMKLVEVETLMDAINYLKEVSL